MKKNQSINHEEQEQMFEAMYGMVSDIHEKVNQPQNQKETIAQPVEGKKLDLLTDYITSFSVNVKTIQDNQQQMQQQNKKMLESITKEFVEKINTDSIQRTQQINKLGNKIDRIEETAKSAKRVYYTYSFNFKQNALFITIIAFIITAIISLFFNYNQYQKNKILSDNDLKYRYLKASYKGEHKGIVFLDSIFIFDRDNHIKKIEKTVREYEYKLQLEAEKSLKIKQNIQENERLLKELEKIKKLKISAKNFY